MAIQSQTLPEIAVLRGLSREQYLAVVEVLAEHHTRHHYAHGELELNSPVYGVTWPQYLAFLEAIGETYCRHNYANETLEIMSPRKDHDWVKRFIGRIIETIAYELDIEIQCIGSTTITSSAVSRGFQPDEAYYVAVERSPSLPMLTPSDIAECFELLGTLSENHVLKTLVAKLRERR